MPVAPDLASCPNCGTPRIDRFCAVCGQDNRRDELTLPNQFVDTFEAVLGFDSRMRRTLRELCIDPGGVVRRYVAGARTRYVHPFRYVLLAAGIWWLAVAIQLPDREVLAKAPPRVVFMLCYGQWVNLAMLPPLAIPLWVAFLGTRTRFAAHLAMVQFACGHVFLFRAVLAGVGYLRPEWGPTLNRIDPFVLCGYLAWTLWSWQRPREWRSWRQVLVVLRVAAALFAFILGSEYVLRAYMWLLGI